MAGQDLPSVPGSLKFDLIQLRVLSLFAPICGVTLRTVASIRLGGAALRAWVSAAQ